MLHIHRRYCLHHYTDFSCVALTMCHLTSKISNMGIISNVTNVCGCVKHALKTSSSVLTRASVSRHNGSAMDTTTVKTCLTNRTAVSSLCLSTSVFRMLTAYQLTQCLLYTALLELTVLTGATEAARSNVVNCVWFKQPAKSSLSRK